MAKCRAYDKLEGQIDDILDTLPHGSGIDSSWTFDVRKNGDVVFRNSYHGMTEFGMYDGWQDFSVVIFAHNQDKLHKLGGPCEGQTQVEYRAGDLDFRLQFNGERSRKSWSCGLHDYLAETIGDALSGRGIGKMRNEIIGD